MSCCYLLKSRKSSRENAKPSALHHRPWASTILIIPTLFLVKHHLEHHYQISRRGSCSRMIRCSYHDMVDCREQSGKLAVYPHLLISSLEV